MKQEEIVRKYVLRELTDRGTEVSSDELNDLTDLDLLKNGILDSLGIPRLVVFLEHEFALQIPLEDITLENFSNIKSICIYLENLQAKIV